MAKHDPQLDIQRHFVSSQLAAFERACNGIVTRAESEIERLLQKALVAAMWGRDLEQGDAASFMTSGKVLPPPPWAGHTVFFNVPLGSYRPDILIVTQTATARQFTTVVECDGHEFHERTKQQAAHDKQRDRWMAAQGIRVFRFTGSEIFRDPIRCAHEVVDAVDAVLMNEAA